MLNVYVIGAEPSWDEEVYHRLVLDYVRTGHSLKGINAEFIGKNQHTQHLLNYLHRPLFFVISGYLHTLTGLPLIQIYPLMNMVFLSMNAFYIYKICNVIYVLPAILSCNFGMLGAYIFSCTDPSSGGCYARAFILFSYC